MQVLVIAVQNAVEYRYLGAATSGATFFRSIGSAFGVAIFGSIFANGLTSNLARFLPAGQLPAGFNPASVQSNPAALQHLPAAVHSGYIHAYAASLQTVFLIATPIGVLAFVLTWFLKEVPLRATAGAGARDPGQGLAVPAGRTSLEEIERSMAVLVSREGRTGIYQRIIDRAGLSLDPSSCWLLFRLDQTAPVSLAGLSARLRVPVDTIGAPLERLTSGGLVEMAGNDGAGPRIALTTEGRAARERLVAARREGLERLLDGWSPEQHAELATLLQRLAESSLADERDEAPPVDARAAATAAAR